jgi:hypothetical protein
MTHHEFERRMVTAAHNHAAGVRRDLVEISAEMTAADAALRRTRANHQRDLQQLRRWRE